MSLRPKFWLFAAGSLVLAQALASFVLPRTVQLIVFSDITQCLLLLCGTVSLLPRVLDSNGRTRLFWALMTLGLAFWLTYQLLWTYIEVVLRQEVPQPFVGDIVLFLHIVPMMAALALQPHTQQDNRTSRLGTLDFALLFIWWIYLYLFAVIPWQYARTDELAYGRNLNALYLTEKMVFLVGLAVMWWRSQSSWKFIYAQWFGASLTYALSSYLANWAIETHVYYSGSLYDVPLAVSMCWVTFIGLLAPAGEPEGEQTKAGTSHGVWVARLGMIAIFSLPLFAAWSIFDMTAPPRVRSFRMVVTLGAMMVMGIMVFLRQHLLDRELIRLLQASQQSFEDLKRLQAQLVQSEKLASLGQLLGGAAHELNNPLTAMLGYSDLLTATSLTDEQRGLAEKMAHQVRRTKTLVSSLLSFARQVPSEKTKVNMNALAQTALKLSQPQLRARTIEVQSEFATDLPQVMGDSNQLLHVCLHIANNAMHAMEAAGGLLTVATRHENHMAVLEFSDNGPGAREPERVFDPFYSTRPVGQGAGLGLSACYGIIQEHAGRIVCENRAAGGATFRIELPAVKSNVRNFSIRKPGHSSSRSAESENQACASLPLQPTP